jgi:hypothetical protein
MSGKLMDDFDVFVDQDLLFSVDSVQVSPTTQLILISTLLTWCCPQI